MPRPAAQVFQAAEEALRAGKFVEAAQAYLAVVRGVPTYLRARFRIAADLDTLRSQRFGGLR